MRLKEIDNASIWDGYKIRGVVIYYLDAIGFGVLGAFIKYYYKAIWQKYKKNYFVLGILLIFFVLKIDKSSWKYFDRIFSSQILYLGILFILPLADSIKTGNKYLVKIITHISVISYSMYLINLAIVAEVIRDNFMPVGLFQSIIIYFVYWFIVIVLATLLYKYFEKPIMDLRDK